MLIFYFKISGKHLLVYANSLSVAKWQKDTVAELEFFL